MDQRWLRALSAGIRWRRRGGDGDAMVSCRSFWTFCMILFLPCSQDMHSYIATEVDQSYYVHVYSSPSRCQAASTVGVVYLRHDHDGGQEHNTTTRAIQGFWREHETAVNRGWNCQVNPPWTDDAWRRYFLATSAGGPGAERPGLPGAVSITREWAGTVLHTCAPFPRGQHHLLL